MLRMDPASLHRVAEELRLVIETHTAWHENLLRALFCDPVAARGDTGPTAHRDCPLGRWYYEAAPNDLRGEPTFVAMGTEHQRLHQVATRLLRAAKAAAPVSRADFEDLVATSARLRLQVDTLRSALVALLADRDALTGAFGRVAMLPGLHELRAAVHRGGRPCTLAFVDVDEFKRVNDVHGHAAGDAALLGVARHLQTRLRADDRVYRYGGDEFLLALPGTELDVALEVLTRVRLEIAERPFLATNGGDPLRMSVSIGLALLDPGVEVEESIHRADQALLLAKTAGRNRVIKWDAAVTTSTRWRRVDVSQVRD